MIWFITSLIPIAALAMGSVHPWAFKALEESILACVGVWIVRIALGITPIPPIDRRLKPAILGPLLLLVTVSFQLLPLPPQIEAWISPGTYNLYRLSLPGWPSATPYSWLLKGTLADVSSTSGDKSASNLTTTDLRRDVSGTQTAKNRWRLSDPNFLPLSVAPSLTEVALLKLLTCLFLGALVLWYPVPANRGLSQSVYGVLLLVLLATGLLLGLQGLLQEFLPNGKPLWVFEPYDFRGNHFWGTRAFGCFANPDHYACFLAMLLPPALAGILFPEALGKVRERAAVPLFSGLVVIVLIVTLLATASRGGMVNASVGIITLIWLSCRLPVERQPSLFQQKRRRNVILAVGALGFLMTAVYLAGSSNRIQAGSRLEVSFSEDVFRTRFIPARNTFQMIRDFPVFGVGLGAWPDLYRKYATPPWSPDFINAAHDEYFQFIAETGVFGLISVTLFIASVGRRATLELLRLPVSRFAVVAACLASLAGLAAHAAFDFPLRIPAIDMLVTIMGATVMRAAFPQQSAAGNVRKLRSQGIMVSFGILAILVALMWIVELQPSTPYPYDLSMPKDDDGMWNLLRSHPANSRIHMTLLWWKGDNMPSREVLEELKTSVALEPTNPLWRDLYLKQLARNSQNEAALAQMTQSVMYAPFAEDHFYLSTNWIPKLTVGERGAIEKGLRAAMADGSKGAVDTLGNYYDALGQFSNEGDLFLETARETEATQRKGQLLRAAGYAFARTGDYARAEGALREAIVLYPEDGEAYEYLCLEVDVPQREFVNARDLIKQGISAGADAEKLYLVLAQVDLAVNDKSGEEEALSQAAALEPSDAQITLALGTAYFKDARMDQAILWLRKAIQVDPSSANAFFELAQAEESVYQFFSAQNDYAKAQALDPGNEIIASRFEQFKERLAANIRPN